MALALVMTMSRSGMAALAAGLAASAAVVWRGHRRAGQSRVWLLAAVFVLLAVAWIGVDAIVTRFADTSWAEFNVRRGAWADARDIAARFPLTGTGLNTYGTATLLYQQHDLAQHYAQAHNDYLQLWAEGGLLLVLPAIVLIVAGVRVIRRRFVDDVRYSTAWWARVGAVTGVVSMALQELVEFSLQMPGNAALFVALCALAMHEPPPRARRGD
jgi:O-antigen ligase